MNSTRKLLLAVLTLTLVAVLVTANPSPVDQEETVAAAPVPQKKPLKSGKDLKLPVNPFPEKKVRAKSASKSADDWLQTEDWGDEDLLQHPIDEEPRRKNRILGEICSYSADCGSGCCLMERETKVRSCQPRALMGERCSSGQVKGDLYVDACPCNAGEDVCDFPSEICRA